MGNIVLVLAGASAGIPCCQFRTLVSTTIVHADALDLGLIVQLPRYGLVDGVLVPRCLLLEAVTDSYHSHM